MVRKSSVTMAAVLMKASLLASPVAVAAGDDAITLRVDDARAEPGGIASVVVRTYAPRGMEQGEICVSTTDTKSVDAKSAPLATRLGKVIDAKSSPMPFVSLEAVEVYSSAGDATVAAAFDATHQLAILEFASPSGTVNEEDGPLAVFHFGVSSELTGEWEFGLELDLEGTYLIDADGEEVAIEPVAGRLEVRSVGDSLRVEAVDERVAPGDVARLTVETYEPLAIASGELALTYDPDVAGGTPVVSMDTQDSEQVTFAVDTSVPGRVVVSFDSPDGSLNEASPGELLTVRLPTSSDLPDGTKSPIGLDPESTYMVDPEGRWIALELKDAELVIDH